MTRFIIFMLAGISVFGCSQPSKLSPEEARKIAKEAYVYGFPLVMNYKTLYAYALEKRSPEYKGDFNEMACDARLYSPEDKAVVTPNSDTPYCMFWSNIREEPVVISVPEVEEGRYYSFQLIDLNTHNFAYIGSLTTGNEAGKYLITSPAWKGETPEGITDIIRCETDLFFTVVRTQLMDENDLENVRVIQNSYQIETLSEYNGKDASSVAAVNNYPAWMEGEQFTVAAFKYLNFMLQFLDPVEVEKPLMEKFAKIGIGTDVDFDTTKFDDETLTAIKEGVKEGFIEIEEFIKLYGGDPLASAKIFGTREFLAGSAIDNYKLKDFYLPRAVAAQTGLYGNSGLEAIYPTYLADADRQPLNASENKYTITFQEGNLPPVKAFWSITMYDGLTQLLINNPLNRYLINSSMMDTFVRGEDGSLTIYIQKESPGSALEANWLPAPDGPFYCVMRLYGPEESALTGNWKNPPIVLTK